MPETIDSMTVALIVAWTTAMVAGFRSRIPAIDGHWVVLVVAGCALVASSMFLAPMPEWVRYALLGFSGAIGGVSLADRFMQKSKGS